MTRKPLAALAMVSAAALVAAATVVLLNRDSRQKSTAPPGPAEPGPVHDVPASIPSDCSRPADADIARFMAGVPDGSTIRFARNGCYSEDGALYVNDRRDLTIDGNGSTFRAVRRDDTTCRPNWWIQGGVNITLTNMTLYGRNPGTWDDVRVPNSVGQCEHGVTFASTQGGALLNSKAFNVFGDPVSFQPDIRKQDYCAVPPPRNIVVDGFEGVNAGRTVGITNGDGITIKNSRFVDMYDAAIDIEADLACEYVRNIKILNNRFGRYRFALLNVYTSTVPPERAGDIEFSGNVTEVEPFSCFPPLYFTHGSVPAPAPKLHGVRIVGNDLKTLSHGIQLDHVSDAIIQGNRLSKNYPPGCANPSVSTKFYGVLITESHDVEIVGNTLVSGPNGGFDGDVSADAATTAVTKR